MIEERIIEDQYATIVDLSRRSAHYRESHNTLKSKCERLKTCLEKEKQSAREAANRHSAELEEQGALLDEARRVIDELKGMLKVSQVNYATVLASHNDLRGELEQRRALEAIYKGEMLHALAERDKLKAVNAALVGELRRRDRVEGDGN